MIESLKSCLSALGVVILICSQPAFSAGTSAPPVSATPASAVQKAPGDKWAVVVGISKFADPRIPELKYSSKDARDFYNYLVDPEGGNFRADHVRMLTDQEATKTNIMDYLGDSFLPRAAAPDDLIVIYLSTHGSPGAADVNNVSYVLAYDTQEDKLYSTGIEMAQLLRIVRERAHTNRIMLVLDTCYAGAGTEGHKGLGRHNVEAAQLARGSNWLVITSSKPDQRSWESEQLRNSYFTYHLINTLRESGNKTPVAKAFDKLKEKVESAVRLDKGVLQTPMMDDKSTGSQIIVAQMPSIIRPAPPMVPLSTQSDSAMKNFGDSITEYVYRMRNAHDFINQRKWLDASAELQKATKLNPTSVEAFIELCDALEAQGRFREALEAANLSVKNGESSSEANARLGKAYLNSGNIVEAERRIKKALSLDPGNSTAMALQGLISQRLDRIDLAEQQYRQALQLNPLNLPAMVNLGYLLQKQGKDFSESEILFRKAIESDSGDPDARLALGKLQAQQGRYEEAATNLKKGLENDPTNASLYCELGDVLSQDRGNYVKAEGVLRKAVQLAPKSGQTHFALGKFLVNCRAQYEEGEKELRAGLALDASLDRCAVALGDLVIDRRKAYDEADSLYNKALAVNPRNTRAHIGLARINSELFKRYAQAQDELQKALAIDPQNSDAYMQQGLILDQSLGRTDEAQQAYKRAIVSDPKNAYAHYYLGRLYLQKANPNKPPDDALSELRLAVNLNPSVSLFHTKLGALLTDRYKLHKEAQNEFLLAIQNNIGDWEAHFRLGMLMIEKFSQRKAGEKELQAAFEQNPSNKDVKAAYERFASH